MVPGQHRPGQCSDSPTPPHHPSCPHKNSFSVSQESFPPSMNGVIIPWMSASLLPRPLPGPRERRTWGTQSCPNPAVPGVLKDVVMLGTAVTCMVTCMGEECTLLSGSSMEGDRKVDNRKCGAMVSEQEDPQLAGMSLSPPPPQEAAKDWAKWGCAVQTGCAVQLGQSSASVRCKPHSTCFTLSLTAPQDQ